MSILPYEPENFYDILEWKPFVPMQHWMEKEVIVNDGGNKGAFSTYKMPHMEKIFEMVDKIRVTKITLKTASQTGKTIMEINVVLKRLDTDPDNSIIMFPKGNQVKKLYDNKVKPYIDGCEVIVKKMEDFVEDTKSHQSSFSKKIGGAILSILDSNNTKSVSAKTIVFDEVSDFPPSKVGEAIERLKSFNGKGELALLASTQDPEKDGKDEINHHYNIAEIKFQYQAYCRNCNKYYYPEPETLMYPSLEEYQKEMGIEGEMRRIQILSDYAPYVRKKAKLQCSHCNHSIDNEQRREQILNKEFKHIEVVPATFDEDGEVLIWVETDEPKKEYKSVAFDVNTLAIEGFDMGEIAEKIVHDTYSENSIHDLKHTWVGYFNRTYKHVVEKTSSSDLLMLSNNIPEWVVPDNTWKIYIGIDMQKDHFWYTVQAFCYGNISHCISAGRIESWSDVEELYLNCTNLKDANGNAWMLSKMGIDKRGYNQDGVRRTDEAIEFVEYMTDKYGADKVYLMEGHADISTAPNGYRIVEVKDKSERRKITDIKMIKFSNLYFKNTMNQSIQRTILKVKEESEDKLEKRLFYINEDIIHQNMGELISTSYVKQMTSETFDFHVNKKTKKKNHTETWDMPKKTDNHIWDCTAATYVFAEIDKVNLQDIPSHDICNISIADIISI